MKKILSFTDYYYPGYKAGGTIRAFMNQVDYLKGHYEFFIVTRNRDYTETQPYPGIIPDQWTHPEPNVHIFYVSEGASKVALFRKILREIDHDVLYLHLLFGFWYSILPLVLGKLRGEKKIIVAAHGVLGRGALGVKPTRKKFFLNAMRWAGFYRGIIFHSVTDHETRDIRTHIGSGTMIREARELPRPSPPSPVRPPKEPQSLKMVTIARISPEKNQAFALEVLAGCGPAAIRYDLVGPIHDTAYWDHCQTLIRKLPPTIQVQYRGSIPSDLILGELQQYDLMFLPTTGENFGHTILESFMAGCPVLISDQTPWKNLADKGIGHDIPLENKEAFRQTLAMFAALDNQSFQELSEKAHTFAQSYCGNPEMLAENISLFE